jgi:hypothetical protein
MKLSDIKPLLIIKNLTSKFQENIIKLVVYRFQSIFDLRFSHLNKVEFESIATNNSDKKTSKINFQLITAIIKNHLATSIIQKQVIHKLGHISITNIH